MNVTLNIALNNIKRTTHRPSMGIKHLKDMPMFCDEKQKVRIKRYIRNGSVTYRVRTGIVAKIVDNVFERSNSDKETFNNGLADCVIFTRRSESDFISFKAFDISAGLGSEVHFVSDSSFTH